VSGLRIAALVKQVPAFVEMTLGSDGRLVREGLDLELGAYCRRAVSKAVELAEGTPDSDVCVITLGPLAAEDALREAIKWGLDRGVRIRGVLASDPAFAGSDTIATARALVAVLEREGPFDLILSGRNSLDSDTGQVPPQVAELLDLPFATGVKSLHLEGRHVSLGCEHDDAWVELELELPALLTCAERLCEPAKVPPDGRALVPAELIERVSAAQLGPGPWGELASPTRVGATEQLAVNRRQLRSPERPLRQQVAWAVERLVESGALSSGEQQAPSALATTGGTGPLVGVLAEPGRDHLTQELLGAAARLASTLGGSTVLLATVELTEQQAGSWGADHLVRIRGAEAEEDIARAVTSWARTVEPWSLIAGSTAYGREVAARAAAALEAGLTGDAVDLEVVEGRLVAWKPAFGGQLVVAITTTTPLQMVTVRDGVLGRPLEREHAASTSEIIVEPRRRVRIKERHAEDSLEVLEGAEVVVGVGQGLAPEDYHELDELVALLGAELGCTRKVTDKAWMPHVRQIGITGRSISPRLYVAIGTSGKFNHMAGVRSAGTVLAINPDPSAPVWDTADVGIVGTWQEVLPLLVDELRHALVSS
jgi:electron transfer flavoprotein alpha subunit